MPTALRTLRGRRREAPHKVIIATSGNAGDLTLVRLLSAGGYVACVGTPLAAPVRDPIGTLGSALEVGFGGEPVRVAIVHPDHLWLMNRLDAVEATREFTRQGWQIITLQRRSPIDRGLSRSVCGEQLEILPSRPIVVDAADVLVHAHTGRLAATWLQTKVDASERIIFEDDLVDAAARQATVDRLATQWGLAPWAAPSDADVPTAQALWGQVQDAPEVKSAVKRLVESVQSFESSEASGSDA